MNRHLFLLTIVAALAWLASVRRRAIPVAG